MEKREFEVTIRIMLEPATIKAGRATAQEVVEACGLLVKKVKYLPDTRTRRQNDAMHLWFEMLEGHCADLGLTMDALFKAPAEVTITKEMLKIFMQQVGKLMYGKEHTSEWDKDEMSEVIKVCEREFARRLDSNIPFPSIENMFLNDN